MSFKEITALIELFLYHQCFTKCGFNYSFKCFTLYRDVAKNAARWVCNDYSPYASVIDMLSTLGWWSLELRRYVSRIAMFYKIVYGLVAIPVPQYFERTMVQTRHQPLAYRQIHTSVSYYYYSFFPMTVILWNRLPADLALDSDLDFLNQESARSTIHSLKA